MLELIQQISPYTPFVIFVASVLDIFFVTGLLLYGAAMLGSIAMMYGAGIITLQEIVVAAYCGTVFGNTLNYIVGRLFGESTFVRRRLEHPRLKKAQGFLQTRGLFLYVLICRFIAISRPLYALLLGSLKIKFHRFILYELIIAFAWVIFWLVILVQGESLFSYLVEKL